MGCICASHNIKIDSNLNCTILNINNNKKNIFNKINEDCLLRIFNFFDFKELHEIGKVDYNFMKISRNPDLLLKFFENKNYIKNKESISNDNENIIDKLLTFEEKNIKN